MSLCDRHGRGWIDPGQNPVTFTYLQFIMNMDISELDHLENSVQDLLSAAKLELEATRLEQQRDEQVKAAVAEIEKRLKPLLADVEKILSDFDHLSLGDSVTRQKLEEKAADLRQQLEEAPVLAAQVADRQLILNEERLLDEQLADQTYRWRQELKADLLDMIAEQEDFYSATDAAVAIRPYIQDLKAIQGLDEVIEALIHQINLYSKEGPVARLRGSHEQTLNFIYDKAMENRARVELPRNVQPRTRHRVSEKQPNPYMLLEGKVVVFGGHDKLATAVKNRLRASKVDLNWCTAQDGLQMAQQMESHIASADLVLIITGYASHALTEKAMQAAQNSAITPEMINTTGMTKVLERIEIALKAKLLARRLNNSTRS